MRFSGFFRTAVCALVCGFLAVPAALAQTAEVTKRPFTVRDSIEMQRILDLSGYDTPGDVARFSPAGLHFVLHTRRGDVDRNVTIESLLLLDAREVAVYLADGDRGTRPSPRVLVQLEIREDGGELSSIQWLNDEEIGFIAQGDNGINQAFAASVKGHVTQLTHSATPVASFSASGDSILYYAHLPVTPLPLVAALGDRTISDLLFQDDGASTPIELFRASRSIAGVERIRAPAVRLFDKRIWISPSGNYAVSFAPAVNAPKEWSEYRMPNHDLFGFTPERVRLDPTSPDLEIRPRYQLIDLRTGAVRYLLDAPSSALFYRNRTPTEVFWPHGGRSVIVSATYLPLDVPDAAERERRRAGPAIAEIDLSAGAVTPIVWEPVITKEIEGHRARLTPIESIKWDDEAGVLTITKRAPSGEITQESFQKRHGTWRDVEVPRTQAADAPEVQRREGLNERPKVYVTGGACTCSKELFDPAPQASQFAFGRTEILRWKDKNDIEWQGGLLYPTNYVAGERYPLIVQTHGFNPDEFLLDGPGTPFAAQALSNAGFFVLQVEDNRQAITFDEHEAPRMAEGFRAAIEKPIALNFADRARIGLIAFSRTGYHAIRLLADQPQLLAAVNITDSIQPGYFQDLLTINGSTLREQLQKLNGGNPSEVGYAEWFARNPLYKLAGITAAVRIEAINRIPGIAMWETYGVLRDAKRLVDLIYFPRGSHNLAKPVEQLGSREGNVDWFRFWLQGYEDSSPAKGEQYKRWRALRAQQAVH